VFDDGIGIAPDALARIFEPFYTTKDVGQGSGLGLAAVYGIVRQSNGFITAESQPGRGATFTMHFPAVAGAVLEAVAPPTHAGGRETILLVEDEDAVRAVVAAVLRRHGYTVLEAATPAAAMRMFDDNASRIDLLVSDVVMPGMNGPALAQRLVGKRPQLCVLLISGYGEMPRPAGDHHNIDFLRKPFQASALADKVQELLACRLAAAPLEGWQSIG
jgi:two-component system cell cycle sensor histidine kinase/response regulator CckA